MMNKQKRIFLARRIAVYILLASLLLGSVTAHADKEFLNALRKEGLAYRKTEPPLQPVTMALLENPECKYVHTQPQPPPTHGLSALWHAMVDKTDDADILRDIDGIYIDGAYIGTAYPGRKPSFSFSKGEITDISRVAACVLVQRIGVASAAEKWAHVPVYLPARNFPSSAWPESEEKGKRVLSLAMYYDGPYKLPEDFPDGSYTLSASVFTGGTEFVIDLCHSKPFPFSADKETALRALTTALEQCLGAREYRAHNE